MRIIRSHKCHVSRFAHHASRIIRLALAAALCSFFFNQAAEGAPTLSVTVNSIAAGSTVDLTTNGPLDWVHWGLFTETSVDRKGGVIPQISDFTLVDASNGFAYVYQYGDNANGYSWSDGTPHMAVTNTTTGVWAYGIPPVGSGFRISVPASTNLQTLKVFVGAFSCMGKLAAFLSDNSAAGYTNSVIANLGSGPSAVCAINFAANSSGQNLTVVYTLERNQGPNPPQQNVTLQAAALTAPGANNVPFVSLTSPTEGASVQAPTDIELTATAHDADGFVSIVEFYANTNKIGEAATAPYSVTWTNPPPGRYSITARATDDGGAVGQTVPVTLFVAGSGGSLEGGRATPPTALNLTTEGNSDWAHWGLSNAASFNHKVQGAGQISNFTLLGTNAVKRYADNRTAFSWTDGTPVASAGPAPVGVYISGLTNGFELTAPADTNLRTLRVYVGVYGAQGNLQAWLSDFSGAAFADTTLSNVFGNSYAVYTLSYAAATNGQQLFVRYTLQNLFDSDYGNVTLQATTLQGPVPPHTNFPPVISITNPANGAVFAEPATFFLNASAFDPDGGVMQVEFFNDASSIGVDVTSSYSVAVNNLSAGSYTFSAVATDNENAKATNSVSITVSSAPVNSPPMVAITNPPNGTVFSAPASFTVEVAASDGDGTVTQVEFFNGVTSLGVDMDSPYSVAVNSLVAGTYTFSAIATDNLGATATNNVGIIVNALPTASITSPANGATFTAPASIAITATVDDDDGSVTNLSFFQGATQLGEDTIDPYSFTWSNVPAGTYTLTVRVTDDRGVTNASTPVTISVTNASLQPVTITSPTVNGTTFSLTFATETGRTYAVEYVAAIPSTNWQTLTNVAGTGSNVMAHDNTTGAPLRFYRVLTQ